MSNQSEAIDKLDRYIRARFPIVAIASHEESRVLKSVSEVAKARGRNLYAWTVTKGLHTPFPALGGEKFDGTTDPIAALEAILSYQAGREEPTPTLFVLCDLHPYLRDPMITRYLRDVAAHFELVRHTLVLVSPQFEIPAELEKVAVILDWPLPDADELAEILAQCERDLNVNRVQAKKIPITLNGNRQAVIQAMRGLTAFEAGSVLLNAIAATGELGDGVVSHIVSEKKQIVRRSGLLEFYEADVNMSHVGGLPHLKQYAQVKRSTFDPAAQQFGVEPARGVLLLGLPGTGKSLSAKAIAGGQMPLLRMDIGALMGGILGQSEANLRSASKVAEAISPCVVWMDEIEKALSGGGGELDGGTSKRVLGGILTWMQETTAPIYFVATANDVRALRPELVNRFDDTIFVDLPNLADRVEILSVHLAKRGRKPGDYDLKRVATATWGFVGREIERVVKSGLEQAYSAGQPLTTEHLVAAARTIVPISTIMAEQINELRTWSKGRALLANDPIEAAPARETSRKARTSDL